ncbi:hypothetical protein H4582DRAFT_2060240 [Lactarius indigo]|nr:hypothetical protein H4582DRAFT_2060240 [Lactarius indigo]
MGTFWIVARKRIACDKSDQCHIIYMDLVIRGHTMQQQPSTCTPPQWTYEFFYYFIFIIAFLWMVYTPIGVSSTFVSETLPNYALYRHGKGDGYLAADLTTVMQSTAPSS